MTKAAEKFGASFDEAKFRSTNPRVTENQQKYDEVHERYIKALEKDDLKELGSDHCSMRKLFVPYQEQETGQKCESST